MVLETTIIEKKKKPQTRKTMYLKNANNFFSHLGYGIYFCYPNLKPQEESKLTKAKLS